MRLSENRKLAWVVLLICALGSVVGLGGSALGRERAHLEKMFVNGTDSKATVRESMDAYLDKAAECVQVMASELELRLGSGNETAKKMQDAVGDLADGGIDARYTAYTTLQRLSDEAYNAIYAANLSDGDRTNFKVAYDDFWGCDKYVRIDPYRTAAASFNDSLDGFPAGAVAGLMGVKEINSFGA